MKKIKIILSGALLAFMFSSCTKTGSTGPAGSNGATGQAGPSLSGTLEGYVDLFDQYGELMTPATGVYVTILGKTGTDSTSSSGMFTKNNLSTGTYELDFAKTGYGSTKVNSLNFVGGGTQYIQAHIQMTQAASFSLTSVTSATATVQGASAVSLTVTPTGTDTKARKVICFFSTSSTVSSVPGNYMGSSAITIPANSATGVGSISTALANSVGIMSGNTIYIAVYPISFSSNASTYADIASGKTIYNNINPASTVATNIVFP